MRIFSLLGDHLRLECDGHTHNWENGYIDVDAKTGKHIMDTFIETGNVGLKSPSGEEPISEVEEPISEVEEESVEETN